MTVTVPDVRFLNHARPCRLSVCVRDRPAVEELDPPVEAAREIADLWAYVEGMVFGRKTAGVG
ncbi:MAG: hypothetical protein ACREE0_10535 [Phenylobacterium sp.]